MAANLILHCGAQRATEREVKETVAPVATKTYMPLAHESFLTRVQRVLDMEGIQVKQAEHALAKDGQRYFGLMELAMPQCPTLGFANILGLRNSYDKSYPAGVVIGSQVFVCDNLAFSGEISFGRRHTPRLIRDLTWLISESIAKLAQKFNLQSERFESYKRRELSNERAHDLVIRLLDNEAINVTDIPRVLDQFRNPTHEEFEGRTAWGMFNAVTEVAKGRVRGAKDGEVVYRPNIWDLPGRTETLHKVMDVECGIEPEPETVVVE